MTCNTALPSHHTVINVLIFDVGVVSAVMPGILNVGRREGVREGRKQGGELEWAAFPVFRRRRAAF